MKINILLVFLHTLSTKEEYIINFSLTHIKKWMKINVVDICTILLIDDDNHSKIFVPETNKYYIKYGDNRSIYANILNEFKDIKTSYKINVIDLSDNYYNIDKSDTKKYCTILLIDDIITSIIFISEKNIYYIRYDYDNFY